MLKGLDPLLSADLLYVLRAMGHGDDLVIADANFPGVTMARRLVRLDGVSAPRALQAILTVLPIDDFVDDPCLRIEVVGDPAAVPEVCVEFQQVLDAATANSVRLAEVDRFAFYDRARQAFAVVQTGETRLYGDVLVKKGVIRPT